MTARLLCLGVSSRGCGGLLAPLAASVELREEFRNALVALAGGGAAIAGLDEHVILSTCHRVELYAMRRRRNTIDNRVATRTSERLRLRAERLNRGPSFDASRGWAGIDGAGRTGNPRSGQCSANRGRTGARQRTDPGRGVSVGDPSRPTRPHRDRYQHEPRQPLVVGSGVGGVDSRRFAQRRVLIVGLGEMGHGAFKDLRKRRVTQLLLANRTRKTAESIAAQCGGTALGLDELPTALRSADIVISATSATSPILTAPMVNQSLAGRSSCELVMLDLAVPRNVEPAVAALPGVRLFDVDNLQMKLEASLALRRREAPRVESIVEEELAGLDRELRQMTVQPLIADLRQKAEAIRRREFERTLGYLRAADPQIIEHVQHLSHSLVNGLLHGPTVRLRELATDGVTADHAAAVRDLFGLES